ncbi:hypothetical protein ABG79_01643 [Caloramator mitchellensis]|uniref:Bacterial toxin 44 domain-containing protein n=1 Tax=Caloramator mitchellensis TaxID=908809 RepID=A0A0R3JZT0_CALMK|nr:polymorphic toxin type 44 domain-containing protein [Caloramator mitchellensis]KRQ86660.1 hypothetical protein ABG79_01643 [Caloramator mitchellensis]
MKGIIIKIINFVLAFLIVILIPFNQIVYANLAYNRDVKKISSDANAMFKEIYKQSQNKNISKIENDYDSYSVLLNNLENVIFKSDNTIFVNVEKISELYKFDSIELEKLNSFINRLNILIKLNAVKINSNLEISVVTNIQQENFFSIKAAVIDILPEARIHADELKKVYENAIFGTKHIVAGVYFTERVKSGGIWDYKTYLGTKTIYYDEGLRAHVSGETIGNFHYGYVGSAVFGPTTLKSAAGLVQIISGTSDISFWSSYFDDPRDTADIQWGIDTYNAEH